MNVLKEKARSSKRARENTSVFRYSVNLSERENADFLTLFEQSGMPSYARFIAARIFDESFKVIKVDKGAIDVYNQLLAFHAQFRAVGVNYNQLIKALKANFTERKAYAMIQKLHKETMKLTGIHEQVLEIAQEFKEKYDS